MIETETEAIAPPRPELAAARIIAGRAIGAIRRACGDAEYPWNPERERKVSGAVRHYLSGKGSAIAAAIAETDSASSPEHRAAAAVAALGGEIVRAAVSSGLAAETTRAAEAMARYLRIGGES